jgi:polyhydroxyalkanoate synthesis regulator phasin
VIAAVNVGQAFWGFLSAATLLGLGKLLDWGIKRRAETKKGALEENADERADELADIARLKQMSDEAYRWGEMQQRRAEQIAAERDVIVKGLTERIEALSREMEEMKASITEKDGIIARQAAKIERLERRVEDLEKLERATHKPGG